MANSQVLDVKPATEQKHGQDYHWRLYVIGISEAEALEKSATTTTIARSISTWSLTLKSNSPTAILDNERLASLIAKNANQLYPDQGRHWQLSYVYWADKTDPATVKDDGKVHKFIVLVDVWSDWLNPKTLHVVVNGPHAHFPGTSEFYEVVCKEAVGKLPNVIVVIRQVHELL